MGLKPHEFCCLTYYEYTCLFSGYVIRASRAWEHTRSINFMLYRVNSTDKHMTPQKFQPLVTDPDDLIDEKITTQEERLQLSEMALQRVALLGDRLKK